LSTKIHALVDALGNPVNFFLTGGEAHDLVGADHLLPSMQADTLIADKAFDADERVIAPLAAAGKTAVIPPKANRRLPRDYDQYIYQARHLIENFLPNSSSSVPSPPATTRPRATSSPPST
jgi:transposase